VCCSASTAAVAAGVAAASCWAVVPAAGVATAGWGVLLHSCCLRADLLMRCI
jgi:hypothetical protein